MANEPSAADRADFLRRLQGYGLEPSALIASSLTTIRSTVTLLAAGNARSMYRPILLKTNDFDVVNRWIGVPDRVFDEAEPFVDHPKGARLRRLNVAETERQQYVSAAAQQEVALPKVSRNTEHELAYEVARAYLHGDSRKLQRYKSWLSERFSVIDIPIWAFEDVTVKSGSVLEFGAGPNVLVARSVTIESGGMVRARGSLKIDATVLQKTNPLHLYPLNPALLGIATRL